MNKIIFSLLGILLITACSDDSSSDAKNPASTGNDNNEVSSCDYTFECESAIHVKDGVLYTSNDSIVFSGPFLHTARRDDWTLSDFMNRLEESYWSSFTLKDTLLTETQVKEKQHHVAFKLSTDDQITFALYSDQESILSFVTDSYNECRQDPNCYIMYQARLDGTENPLNGEIVIDSTSIKNDIQNFMKLRALDLEGESTCKLTNTKCKKDQYVTD